MHTEVLSIRATPWQIMCWRAAAERAGLPLREWVARRLDTSPDMPTTNTYQQNQNVQATAPAEEPETYPIGEERLLAPFPERLGEETIKKRMAGSPDEGSQKHRRAEDGEYWIAYRG